MLPEAVADDFGLPVGWLADLYGTAFVTLAGALVQTAAGLPLFLALEAEPTSVANLFVAGPCHGSWQEFSTHL